MIFSIRCMKVFLVLKINMIDVSVYGAFHTSASVFHIAYHFLCCIIVRTLNVVSFASLILMNSIRIDREREKQTERETEARLCVYGLEVRAVCVCVCVREREKECVCVCV